MDITKQELMRIQKLVEEGKLKEEDLTREQVQALKLLYDIQINDLKIQNSKAREEILEDKKKDKK